MIHCRVHLARTVHCSPRLRWNPLVPVALAAPEVSGKRVELQAQQMQASETESGALFCVCPRYLGRPIQAVQSRLWLATV
jgi:hypothetical protein